MENSVAILENLGTQFETVDTIREQLFEVKKLQLHTGLEGFDSPKAFATFKNTGGNALGVVGDNFEPTQPVFLFDNFVESLMNTSADLNTLEYKELKGGARIMLSANIGKFSYTNLQGKDDELIMKINAVTGFDGTTKTSVFLSTYRMICANGMKSWKTEYNLAFKNTKGNIGKANIMLNEVAKAINTQNKYKLFLKTLTTKKITTKEQNEYLQKVTGMNLKDYNALSTRSRNILDKINQSVAIEMQDAGATAWALLNGITRYTNHEVKSTNKESFEYIYAGSGLNLNHDAQKVAFEMFCN